MQTEELLPILLQTDVQAFIRANMHVKTVDLLLRKQPWSGELLREIVNQIEGGLKAKTKLPAWFGTAGIVFPPALSMEQCSSEATANYKASVFSGKSMLDLTGGFGVDCFSLARSFEQATYLEQMPQLVEIAKHNAGTLGLKHIRFVNTAAEDFLQSNSETYDLIYLDPARRDQAQRKVFRFADCQPDISVLKDKLLQMARKVVIKASPLVDITLAIEELKFVAEIHVIALHNECKELLFILEKDAMPENIKVVTVNLPKQERFIFSLKAEKELHAEIGEISQYLYEPNAAVMKAGAFKSAGNSFGLKKLHANTHLYTSDTFLPDFPGRVFEVKQVMKVDKKLLTAYLPHLKANLTIRNFPSTVEELRKKLHLKDGGEDYIFASETLQGKVLICTKKVQ